MVGRQDLGAGLQRAHGPLRQRGLHPAASVVQALVATDVLRRKAIQRGSSQRRPVVRPAPAAAPAPAPLGCPACEHAELISRNSSLDEEMMLGTLLLTR